METSLPKRCSTHTPVASGSQESISIPCDALREALESFLSKPVGRRYNQATPHQISIVRQSLQCLDLLQAALRRVGVR